MRVLKVITLCAHYPHAFLSFQALILSPICLKHSDQLRVLQLQFVLENPLVVNEDHNEYFGKAEEATDLSKDCEY